MNPSTKTPTKKVLPVLLFQEDIEHLGDLKKKINRSEAEVVRQSLRIAHSHHGLDK